MTKIKKDFFVNGPISPEFIANCISNQSALTNIGAHDIFLGQVRNDIIENKKVISIHYEAYHDMAHALLEEIYETALDAHNLIHLNIYHSIGKVQAGAICLFVLVCASHRQEAFEASRDIVEKIKLITPIWGKEIFEDESYVWKENQF